MLLNNASRQKPQYRSPPALLLHAAIEFLDAPVNFALGNAVLFGQRNPIVRRWFLCNRLSTDIYRRRRAGNVLKWKILFRSRQARCVLQARLGKRKHDDAMRRNKGLGFNNAFSAQRYGAIPNNDARTRRTRERSITNAGPYAPLGSIKLCALPQGMLSYFWCRGDTKPSARINPIAREEKQVSTGVEEQRRMQESASRLSCGGCLYRIINLHTYVFSPKDKRSRNNLLCRNRNARVYIIT